MDGVRDQFDEAIARACFYSSLGWVDSLKAEKLPLAYGKAQYYQSLIPRREPDDILEESYPYWWAYAETVREFKELFESFPKQEFVSKKK